MNFLKRFVSIVLCMALSFVICPAFAEECDEYAEAEFGSHNPHKVSDIKESLDIIFDELENELTIFGQVSDSNVAILANELLNLSSATDIDDKKNKRILEDILEKTDELLKDYEDTVPLKQGESITSYDTLDGLVFQIEQTIERNALIGKFEGYDPDFFKSSSVSSYLNESNQQIIDGLTKRAYEVRRTPMIDPDQKSVSDITFSDISPDDWFYDEVMEMTSLGLFTGKGEIIDGVGIFAPNDIMSRAEFMAVVCRMAFPNEDTTPTGSWSTQNIYTGEIKKSEAPWFSGYYNVLNSKGIFRNMDLIFHIYLQLPISREEMAQIATRILQTNGVVLTTVEEFKNFNPEISIPDYDLTSEDYRNAVKVAYIEGILQGIDDSGTFAPDNTLTRAEASAVLYRILIPEARVK